MMRLPFHSIVLTSVFLMLVAATAHAAPFSATASTPVLAAPGATDAQVASVEPGTIVEVTHQAGAYWRVELPDGKSGYVRADALQQTKTRGLFVPIIVMAAAPIAKVVVSKAMGWFKKLMGITPGSTADQVLGIGQELVVLAQKAGFLQVQMPDGAVGWIKQGPEVVELQPVSSATPQAAGIWKNSQPIPQSATGLTLQVQVRKVDGTPAPAGGTLKLGDEYRIYITPSADCYVRITCETPDFDHACQYYPNQFSGFQTSSHFKAGQTYAVEMLPPGVNFKVSEPIGAKDILRIEATTAAPYHYVPATDGCAPTTKFKGGGFSVAGDVQNPTAQVVVEYPIKTSN